MKNKLFYKPKVFILLFISLFILSCSSENTESTINVSSYYPVDVSPTALHEQIIVQFTKVSGIGAADTSACLPVYQLKIGTNSDVNSAVDLGVISPNDSLLVRFSIKKSESAEDASYGFPFFYYPELTDNQEYTIWLRSDFTQCGYGYSNWTSAKSSPVPLPTQLENVQVEQGDNHLRISWTKKQGELYAVHLNDCPSKAGQYTKWTPALSLNSDHYIVELENNDTVYDSSNGKSICIVSHNANGFLDANGSSTWKVFGIDLYNQTEEKAKLQGKAATLNPEKPVINIESVKGKNKRAEFTFNTVSTGESAVSNYQAGYSLDGSNFSNWVDIPFTQDVANAIISGLENDKLYYIKIRASNSFSSQSSSWVESDAITVTPEYTPIDINDANQYLGTAEGDFIYAENVPHSDFWRISTNFNTGGRPNSDRLVRGKETALGNLYADAVHYYVTKILNKNVDFTVLAGEMITNGMANNLSITPRILMGLTEINYISDPIVILEIEGKYLINENDYNINLDNYPPLGVSNTAATLFGQAAAVLRDGRYGTGAGGASYSTKSWLLPSKEVRYTIEYLPYSLQDFQANFQKNCGRVEDNADYDSINDPKKCYLLSYNDTNAWGNSFKEGYRRGRIQKGSLLINGKAIEPNKIYKVATTKKLADSMYTAFLYAKSVENTGVIFWKAVAYFINEQGKITPYLDGRVKLTGGVPGNTANDFK